MKFGTIFDLAIDFKSLFDDILVACAIVRLSDSLFIEANASFLSLIGYCREEVVGNTSPALKLWRNPEQRKLMRDMLSTHGYVKNFIHDLTHKSGRVCRVSGSAHIITQDGEPFVMLFLTEPREFGATVFDLPEMKERIRFAEIAANIGFWHTDILSGLTTWSPGMELLHGIQTGSFGGTYQDFLRNIHPEDFEFYNKQRDAAIAARRPFDLTFRIVRADGGIKWINSRGAPTYAPDGSIFCATGINIDITEHMQGQGQLLMQAEVMANMAEGVCLVNSDTSEILFTNDKLPQILGYESGELIGQHVSMLNGTTEQDPVLKFMEITAELQSKGFWRGELQNRKKNGEEIWCRWSVSSFAYSKDKVWVGVCSDITEVRNAELQRDFAMNKLHRLSARIQESIEAERGLISMEIHDQIGANLTAVRMKIERLASQLNQESGSYGKELLQAADILRETSTITRNICSRLRPPMLDDLGLAQTCRWYARDWSAITGIKAVTRVSRINFNSDPSVTIDLFRVLQELLTNVGRHAGASQVRVSLSAGKRGLCLRVADNGQGFDPSLKHAGFGLLGIRERVVRHRGSVEIESGPAGTEVRVTIQPAIGP